MKYRWLVFAPVALLAMFTASVPAYAANPIVTEPTDFYFDYEVATQFIAQTYMVQGFNSDPMLWLYNEAGTVLASNDDSIGLQSYIAIELAAGRYRLRAGICCGNPDAWHTNQGWNLQYELGFNGNASMQTTTVPTTTSLTTTTTTVPPTTTTSTTSTTSTTTTLPASTTSTTSTTTSSTTTTAVPTTTTTTTVQSVPLTTTSLPTTTTTASSSTTTLPIAAPTTSVIETTTTTTKPIATTLPQATTTTVAIQTSTTTSLPVEALTAAIEPNASQEQVAKAVTAIIEQGISKEEATELATNPKVLASVDAKQAQEIFEAIDIEELTTEQAAELVSAVQDAPTEVKQAFEAAVNVFAGAVDTYVPIGSSVPVSSRRVLIAVTAAMSMTPAPRRKQ